MQYIFGLYGLNDDQRAEVLNVFNDKLRSINGDLSRQVISSQQELSVSNGQLKRQWREILAGIYADVDNREISDELKTGLKQAIGGVDITDEEFRKLLYSNNGFDPLAYFREALIDPIDGGSDEVKKAYSNLIKYATDPGNLGVDELDTKIKDALDVVFPSEADADSRNRILNALGLGSIGEDGTLITDASKRIKEIADKIGPEFESALRGLSAEDANRAYQIVVKDGFSGTFEGLKNEIHDLKESSVPDMEDLTDEVNKFISGSQVASEALAEYNSSGTLSADTISKLKAEYGDLTGVLTQNADGFALNASAMQKFNAEAGKEKLGELIGQTETLIQKYNETAVSLQELQGQYIHSNDLSAEENIYLLEKIQRRQASLDEIKAEINSRQQLIATLSSAISEYNGLKAAMSSADAGDRYDEVAGFRE